jgi:hypothetical protein
MSNNFASAFDELQACFADETGQTQTCTVNGVGYPCVATEISKDNMLIHGGNGETGGYSVLIKSSLFATAPIKVQSIVYQGETLSVLSFKLTNSATYEIVAGDFAMNA